MRRVLIWSILTAIVAVILIGVGYWAYWNFFARFQPMTITQNQAEIQRLLDEASWVSEGGGGQPVYVVGWRDSAAMDRYLREEAPRLKAGGAEPRFILFARPDREGAPQSTPAERATIAELWLTRDWRLFQRWTSTPPRSWTAQGVAPADGNLAREAVVDATRRFDAELTALLQPSGVEPIHPLVLWRDREGFLKACACADARGWAFIRDDLGAPDWVGDPSEAPVAGTVPSMSYPDVSGAPPIAAPGQAVPQQAGSDTQPSQTPQAPKAQRNPPAPSRPAQPPRAAPQAQKQDDTTFF